MSIVTNPHAETYMRVCELFQEGTPKAEIARRLNLADCSIVNKYLRRGAWDTEAVYEITRHINGELYKQIMVLVDQGISYPEIGRRLGGINSNSIGHILRTVRQRSGLDTNPFNRVTRPKVVNEYEDEVEQPKIEWPLAPGTMRIKGITLPSLSFLE